MKRITKIISFAFAFLLCAQTVHADVIWEPNNSFYNKHFEECEIIDRQFVANGPYGKVIVYKSPELAVEIGTIENGDATWITWTYTDSDGIVWGCPNEMEDGWLPMDYMEVVYDYISFEQEHGDAFVEESGSLDESCLEKSVYIWDYPGSETGFYLELKEMSATWTPEYFQTYVDEEGRKWGFCGYYYGSRNFWVCIDEPEANYETLYGEAVPEDVSDEVVTVPEVDENQEPIVPKQKIDYGMIGVAVAAVAAVTIFVLKKMKK